MSRYIRLVMFLIGLSLLIPFSAGSAQEGSPPVYLPLVPNRVVTAPANQVSVFFYEGGYSGEGLYTVRGEVVNMTAAPVFFPKVAITLYNAAQVPVGSAWTYTMLTRLGPGERVPFREVVSSVPAGVDHYALDLSWQTESLISYHPVEVVSLQVGAGQITGWLRNNTGVEMKNVMLAISVYDAAGRLTGAEWLMSDPATLVPGASGTFYLNTAAFGDFSLLRVVAQGEE